MITYVLSTDVLGSTRFTFSPLAEVTLSLRLLGSPHPTHIHGPWLRRRGAGSRASTCHCCSPSRLPGNGSSAASSRPRPDPR